MLFTASAAQVVHVPRREVPAPMCVLREAPAYFCEYKCALHGTLVKEGCLWG